MRINADARENLRSAVASHSEISLEDGRSLMRRALTGLVRGALAMRSGCALWIFYDQIVDATRIANMQYSKRYCESPRRWWPRGKPSCIEEREPSPRPGSADLLDYDGREASSDTSTPIAMSQIGRTLALASTCRA